MLMGIFDNPNSRKLPLPSYLRKKYENGNHKVYLIIFFRRYPILHFCINESVGICGDYKNAKRFKSDDDIIGKLFPSLPKLFQQDQTCRRGSMKGLPFLNYKQIKICPNVLPNVFNIKYYQMYSTTQQFRQFP